MLAGIAPAAQKKQIWIIEKNVLDKTIGRQPPCKITQSILKSDWIDTLHNGREIKIDRADRPDYRRSFRDQRGNILRQCQLRRKPICKYRNVKGACLQDRIQELRMDPAIGFAVAEEDGIVVVGM